MRLHANKTIRLMCSVLAAIVVSSMLGACSSDSSSSAPPSLTLNPSDLSFQPEKNNSQSFEIKTDADWTIMYVPSWLSASSMKGSGTTQITLTTTSENKTAETKNDVVQVKAGEGENAVTREISVSQIPGIETYCYARIAEPVENNQLIMSYGLAFTLECGTNTQYFYWKVYSDADYQNVKGDDDQIVRASKQWTRVNVNSTLHEEIVYGECMPGNSYYLVTVSYASNGSNGEVYAYNFSTKSSETAPLAYITPESDVVREVHEGNEGPWYKWEVKKSGTCNAYYTYVCASDVLTETMKNRKGAYGEYNERDGINVAWEIWKEHKENMLTHTTSFNKDNYGGREKLYEVFSEGATQVLAFKTSDKYLQIVTWGVDRSDNYSGLVTDVVYEVENGQIKGIVNADPTFSVSPNVLVFSSKGETKTVTVKSSGVWNVTSSQESWCTVSPAKGSGNGSFNITTTQNSSTSTRTATVTISDTVSGKSATVSITQNPFDESKVGRDDYGDDKDLDSETTVGRDDYDSDKDLD